MTAAQKRILVVEDDDDVRDVVVRILERAGWSLRQAKRGAQAGEIQKRQPHDVVLLDLDLPDADGLELLPALLSLRGDFSVVVLTGDDRVRTAVEAMRLGAENVLTKPVDKPGSGSGGFSSSRTAKRCSWTRWTRWRPSFSRSFWLEDGDAVWRDAGFELVETVKSIRSRASPFMVRTGSTSGRSGQRRPKIPPRVGPWRSASGRALPA